MLDRLTLNGLWQKKTDGRGISSRKFAAGVNSHAYQLETLEPKLMLSGSHFFGPQTTVDEDFEDGTADDFTVNDPDLWSVVPDANGNMVYQTNGQEFKGLATAVIDVPGRLNKKFTISADVRAVGGLNRWLDGFIVFDYQSDTDFKFAGFFAGQNQWVIGHFDGDFSERIAQVDLDETGEGSIDPNKTYHLDVVVKNKKVQLLVDGEEVLDAKFKGRDKLNDGKVGMMTYNTVTQFDNFTVQEKPSGFGHHFRSFLNIFKNDDLFNLCDNSGWGHSRWRR
ncbi:hypothetical protein Pla110_04610 [Polystyrenella longa]|uniref:3-keto-disaccharide hydrolase domain-containing protein n=1 Tax=Polystyrenella longa TaxID=2528007 RepID=A0A518CHQ6_9PLAN|nr:LamG domain-containing protein [Polystyrenella longa]QDU78757.1 hypothetical protein Pla110_04610 [Polystyrenella longa]